MLLEVSVERFIVDMDYGRMIAKSLILLYPKFISQTQIVSNSGNRNVLKSNSVIDVFKTVVGIYLGWNQSYTYQVL